MLATPQDIYYEVNKSNPHSIIEIWASNMYSRINRIMRYYPLDAIIQQTPNAVRYIKSLLIYFDTYGVSTKTLASKRIKTLYRGVDSKVVIHPKYLEKGFMSTTWEKAVANRFATNGDKDGVVICYPISMLPSNAKYVIIDSTVAPYLRESEVLFLPGLIEQIPFQTSNDACIHCKYTPAFEIIDQIRKVSMPKQKKIKGGGLPNMTNAINESLGKTLVYYRVRYQQPVEIFSRLDIPTTWEKACDVIRFSKVKMEQRFEEAMNMIPEYVILRDKLRHVMHITPDIKHNISIMNGFELYPALYDPKTKEVLTIHYMLPRELFYDLFDKKREKDVVHAIKQWAMDQIWFE